jgi:hypothetical protein
MIQSNLIILFIKVIKNNLIVGATVGSEAGERVEGAGAAVVLADDVIVLADDVIVGIDAGREVED